MGKGGSDTSTSTTSANPYYEAAYANTLSRAQNVADTPYQAYGGEGVAGINWQQQAGYNETNNAYGDYQGDQKMAQGDINNSATGSNIDHYGGAALDQIGANGLNLSNASANTFGNVQQYDPGQAFSTDQIQKYNGQNLQQYQDPYVNSVVKAQEAANQQANATGQSQLAGNAISQGAFGGDRAAIAAASLQSQNQTAQASQIAQLYSNSYTNAQQELNNQQQLQLSAGTQADQLASNRAATRTSLGLQQGVDQSNADATAANQQMNMYENQQQFGLSQDNANSQRSLAAGQASMQLGQTQQNEDLGQAQADTNAGNAQQQYQQNVDNYNAAQFAQKQAYPFQTTGWLANIAEGAGSAAGGTTTNTTPGPSAGSQVAGGITTAAALAAMGSYAGWFAKGGAVKAPPVQKARTGFGNPDGKKLKNAFADGGATTETTVQSASSDPTQGQPGATYTWDAATGTYVKQDSSNTNTTATKDTTPQSRMGSGGLGDVSGTANGGNGGLGSYGANSGAKAGGYNSSGLVNGAGMFGLAGSLIGGPIGGAIGTLAGAAAKAHNMSTENQALQDNGFAPMSGAQETGAFSPLGGLGIGNTFANGDSGFHNLAKSVVDGSDNTTDGAISQAQYNGITKQIHTDYGDGGGDNGGGSDTSNNGDTGLHGDEGFARGGPLKLKRGGLADADSPDFDPQDDFIANDYGDDDQSASNQPLYQPPADNDATTPAPPAPPPPAALGATGAPTPGAALAAPPPTAQATNPAVATTGAPQPTSAAAPQQHGNFMEGNPWKPLLTAGLAMMAGRSPHAWVNIGQGGLAGVQEADNDAQFAAQKKLIDSKVAASTEQTRAAKLQNDFTQMTNPYRADALGQALGLPINHSSLAGQGGQPVQSQAGQPGGGSGGLGNAQTGGGTSSAALNQQVMQNQQSLPPNQPQFQQVGADGKSLQPIQIDDPSHLQTPPVDQSPAMGEAQRQILQMKARANYLYLSGDGRSGANLDRQIAEIAGPHAIIGNDGRSYVIPGSGNATFADSQAKAAGESSGKLGYAGALSSAEAWGKVAPALATHQGESNIDTAAIVPREQARQPYTFANQDHEAGVRTATTPATWVENGQEMQGTQADLINRSRPVDATNAFLNGVGQNESGGGRNNGQWGPGVTATGFAGFTDRTFLDAVKTGNPEITRSMSDQEILAAKSDPFVQKQATYGYAKMNAPVLERNGIPVTNGTLDTMHLFGPGDGVKVLKADPNTPMTQVGITPDALAHNPWMQNMTAGQVQDKRNAVYGRTVNMNPLQPNGNGTQSGTSQAGIPGKNIIDPGVMDARKVHIAADDKENTLAGETMDHANIAKTRLLQMRNLIDQIPNTGSNAKTRLTMTQLAQTYLPPEIAQMWTKNTAGMSDLQAAEEYQKLSQVGAAQADSEAMGNHQSAAALRLFSDANPGLQLQQGTNKAMINVQLIQHQMDMDYAAGLQKTYAENSNKYLNSNGQKAQEPLSNFESQWNQKDTARTYSAAMSAMNGVPFTKWSSGLSPQQGAEVARIIARIDPTAQIQGNAAGQQFTVGQFQPRAQQ